jgi:hypothetical protein
MTRIRPASGSCCTKPLRRPERSRQGTLLPPQRPLPTPTRGKYLVHELERYGVAIRGRSEIAELHGADGELEAVTLGSAATRAVEALTREGAG